MKPSRPMTVLRRIMEPPLWLLALRLAVALGLLGLGFQSEPDWARITLHALGWLAASIDVILYMAIPKAHDGGSRLEPLMWLAASVVGFAAGLSGSGVVCAVAARAAWEWVLRLRAQVDRQETSNMGILPKNAEVYRSGAVIILPPEQLVPGDAIIVRPGAVIPADALVVKGESRIRQPDSTGVMRLAAPGGRVYAGEVNETGLLAVKAEQVGEDTRACRLQSVLLRAANTGCAPESWLRRLYTVLSIAAAVCALGIAVLPPLLLQDDTARDGVSRAAGILMAACPLAALGFGPLLRVRAVFDAQRVGGRAAPDTLWALARTDMVVLDKTGIHEPGSHAVVGLELEPDADRDMLLHCATVAYAYAEGPLSEAVRGYCGQAGGPPDSREALGGGVTARSAGHTIHAGSTVFLRSRGVECPDTAPTVVRIAMDGRLLGGLRIGQKFRPGAETLAKALAALRLETAYLSPEAYEEAELPASRLGIRDIHAGVPAEDRARVFSELLKETRGRALLLGTDLGEQWEGMVVIPDAWNDADALARGHILLAGPSPEPLGRLIARVRSLRRLTLVWLGAALLLTFGLAVLAITRPSWLWLAGLCQSLLGIALSGLAAKTTTHGRKETSI